MANIGSDQSFEVGNVTEIIFDNVTVNNANLKLIVNNGAQNISELTLASKMNLTEYSFQNEEKCSQEQKIGITIMSNNFGLIDKYRVNLLNVISLNKLFHVVRKSTALNIVNVIHLEMVVNKFKDIVTKPIVYLFYKTENLLDDDEEKECSYTTSSLVKNALDSRILQRSIISKITPNTIILDVNDEPGELFQTSSINFVCNCTLYNCLILNNMSMSSNETSSFVNEKFMNNLTEDEKIYVHANFSRYISKCQKQCENTTKEIISGMHPQNISREAISHEDEDRQGYPSNKTETNKKETRTEITALAKHIFIDEQSRNYSRSNGSSDQKYTVNSTHINMPSSELDKYKYQRSNNEELQNTSTHSKKNLYTTLLNLLSSNISTNISTSDNFWSSFGQLFSKIADKQSANMSLKVLFEKITNEENSYVESEEIKTIVKTKETVLPSPINNFINNHTPTTLYPNGDQLKSNLMTHDPIAPNSNASQKPEHSDVKRNKGFQNISTESEIQLPKNSLSKENKNGEQDDKETKTEKPKSLATTMNKLTIIPLILITLSCWFISTR